MAFRSDFIWGVASSSAQVEGAYKEDGKLLSIWDVAEGHIKNNDDCHFSCDQYHKYKEDVTLIKKINAKAYRFSISMCRIIKEDLSINQKGVEYYNNLINELIDNNIEPMITLYHWDLPLFLQERGGWENPQIIEVFDKYTKICVDAFSDRVKWWMTFNEPLCFIMLGYVSGTHAPFIKDSSKISMCLKNFLLAHGRSVKTIRKYSILDAKIGIVNAASVFIPKSKNSEDVLKAYKESFETDRGKIINSYYMDPILLGIPPKGFDELYSKDDLTTISTPIDFIGLNTYQPLNEIGTDYKCEKFTQLNWKIDGRVLYWVVNFYNIRYKKPLMITENGMAWNDVVVNHEVNDVERCEFIKEYIYNLKKAVDEGIDVLGYLHWSILDNFEWAEGYTPRFGLIHVDYKTQIRTIKRSGYYYSEIIKNNGENI